jgi:hypothetical protein
MSDDIDINEPGALGKAGGIFSWLFNTSIGAISSVILNGLFGFLPTVFSGIVLVLKPIFILLHYVLFKIVPFLVTYIGIPLFILGAVMAVMFLGGHILWVILFVVGIFLYVRGIFNIKLVNKAITPKLTTESENTMKFK